MAHQIQKGDIVRYHSPEALLETREGNVTVAMEHGCFVFFGPGTRADDDELVTYDQIFAIFDEKSGKFIAGKCNKTGKFSPTIK